MKRYYLYHQISTLAGILSHRARSTLATRTLSRGIQRSIATRSLYVDGVAFQADMQLLEPSLHRYTENPNDGQCSGNISHI